MLATDYARNYNIPPQKTGESNSDFKYRVAGKLREMGNIIESHEVLCDKRYDESPDVITGITGAMAMIMENRGFHGDPERPNNGERQLDDDFAAGILTRHQINNPPPPPEVALLSAMLFSGNKKK